VLTRPAADTRHVGPMFSWAALGRPVMSFFRKPGIVRMLAFLLLYRLAEAQLVSLVSPFLLDDRDTGGLGLTTAEVGFVYGTLGIAMLSLGGILGGLLVARDGLGRWLWPMALAINLPNLAYVWLASAQPESLWAIALAMGFEQFGYGFGFTAYMVFCMVVARGDHQTVHYALCTGFAASADRRGAPQRTATPRQGRGRVRPEARRPDRPPAAAVRLQSRSLPRARYLLR